MGRLLNYNWARVRRIRVPSFVGGLVTHIQSSPSTAAVTTAGQTVAFSAQAQDDNDAPTGDPVYFVSKDTRLGLAHKTTGLFTTNTPKVPGTARVYTQLTDPDGQPNQDSALCRLAMTEDFSSFANLDAFDSPSRFASGVPAAWAFPVPGEFSHALPARNDFMAIVPTGRGTEKAFRMLLPGYPTGGGRDNVRMRTNVIPRVASVPSSHTTIIEADFSLQMVDAVNGSLFHDLGDGPGIRLKFFEAALRPNSGRYQFGAGRDLSHGNLTSWQVRHTMFTNPESNAFAKSGITPDQCMADRQFHHFKTWHAGSTQNVGTVDVLMYEFDILFSATQSFTTGDRILIGPRSTAEFIVLYNIQDNTWRIQRAPDISGSTHAVNGSIINVNHETHSVRFSVSQANVVFPGSMIAITNFGGFTISNTDYNGSTFDLKPLRHPTDAFMTVGQDLFGYPFSSHLDGFSDLWMDGELVHSFRREHVGVTSSDGYTPWCVMEDLATITPGVMIEEVVWGDNTTWTTDPYYCFFTNIKHSTTFLRRAV